MSNFSEIVVVSGLPRSGTSLLMQMLTRGGLHAVTDNVRSADTDNPKGYFEFEPVKKLKDDKTWLPQARGKVVKIISQLLYQLPATEEYKIIFMHRDIDEILASQEKMLIRRGQNLPDRDAIRSAFSTHLERVFQWLSDQPTMNVFEMNYNDVIRYPQEQALRIANFLDQDLNVTELALAIDNSLYRNREIHQVRVS